MKHITSKLQLSEDDVGCWIAIIGSDIVAKDKQLKRVYREAKNLFPDKEPLLDIYLGDIAMVV